MSKEHGGGLVTDQQVAPVGSWKTTSAFAHVPLIATASPVSSVEIVPLRWWATRISVAALHERNGNGGVITASDPRKPEVGNSKSVPRTCPTTGLGVNMHEAMLLMAPGSSTVPQSV